MPNTVYLDHLIQKDTIFRSVNWRTETSDATRRFERLDFSSIMTGDRLYRLLRKPDFQRATNSWDSEKCVDFLDTVVNNLLVPHLILWASPRTRNVYILDGAHRISVLRAWMQDDWGDSGPARHYYTRHDWAKISSAADEARQKTIERIGPFKLCKKMAQREEDDPTEFSLTATERDRVLAKFYRRLEQGDGLEIHWAQGDYEYAAQSFVRINRGGQQLDPTEVFLIEYRHNTFIRALMAIAGGNAGEADFWPERSATKPNRNLEPVPTFNETATNVYRRLFFPRFDVPPTDVNQPLMPEDSSYRTQDTLRQVLPIIIDGEICTSKKSFEAYFTRRYPSISDESAVFQATRILKDIEKKLRNFTSLSNNENLSLDIVPLFYWYNLRGGFVSAMCFGFFLWMLRNETGDQDELRHRKLVFSGNRDRFEFILHTFKQRIAAMQDSRGAGLRSATLFAEFYSKLLRYLHENRDVNDEETLSSAVNQIIQELLLSEDANTLMFSMRTEPVSTARSARNTSVDTHGKILRLFESNHRCPICGGHVDWKRYHQMEHLVPYREQQETTPLGTAESHQFCNNNGDIIRAYRIGARELKLPIAPERQVPVQLGLYDWGENSEFPEGGFNER
jgi:hypothetical protein